MVSAHLLTGRLSLQQWRRRHSALDIGQGASSFACRVRVNASRLARSERLQFSLSPNPHEWGANLSPNYTEDDDEIHNPDPKRDHKYDQGGTIFTQRGVVNVGCVVILFCGLIALL